MRNYFKLAVYLFVAAASFSASADPKVDFFRAVNVDDDRTVKGLLAQGLDPNTANPQMLVRFVRP